MLATTDGGAVTTGCALAAGRLRTATLVEVWNGVATTAGIGGGMAESTGAMATADTWPRLGASTRRTRMTLLAVAIAGDATTSTLTSNVSGIPSLRLSCRSFSSAALSAQVDASRRWPRDKAAAAGTSRT